VIFIIDILRDGFWNKFQSDISGARGFFAPGRINLIGEHIDYNGGLVLPCAVDMGTYVAVKERSDNLVQLASFSNLDTQSFSLDELAFDVNHSWANYPKGIVRNFNTKGFDMYIYGSLPSGAGLSSSASLLMATAYALNTIYGNIYTKTELAEMCQKAEAFNGVNCGIMDPFISVTGKENSAVLLDCNILEYSYIPLQMGDYKFVIMNTNKRRALAASKYNERRAECEEALKELQQANELKNAKYLCDISIEEFTKHKHLITNKKSADRAGHAVYENQRVKTTAHLLKRGNKKEAFNLLQDSHNSLKDLYEVSCDELDILVDTAYEYSEKINKDSVLGARMTGAGFGGCAIAVVRDDCISDFIKYVGKIYTDKTRLFADFYAVTAAGGAKELDLN